MVEGQAGGVGRGRGEWSGGRSGGEGAGGEVEAVGCCIYTFATPLPKAGALASSAVFEMSDSFKASRDGFASRRGLCTSFYDSAGTSIPLLVDELSIWRSQLEG